jgi:hypothetical protein
LFLTYNAGGEPIPEPGTWMAAILLTGLAACLRLRVKGASAGDKSRGIGPSSACGFLAPKGDFSHEMSEK